jgi:hypothetical protein
MGRLIDCDALLAAYDAAHKGPPGGARKLIEQAPTIDAVPLDKLCDWLAEKAVFFANDNDSDPEAWKETIKECVMEGERETD